MFLLLFLVFPRFSSAEKFWGRGVPGGRRRSPLPPGDRTDRTGRDGRTPPDHPGRTDGQEKLCKTLFFHIFLYFSLFLCVFHCFSLFFFVFPYFSLFFFIFHYFSLFIFLCFSYRELISNCSFNKMFQSFSCPSVRPGLGNLRKTRKNKETYGKTMKNKVFQSFSCPSVRPGWSGGLTGLFGPFKSF